MISIVVDTCDPVRLADFWATLSGASINRRSSSSEWVVLEGLSGTGYLAFQLVPEPKVGKNRIHIDLLVDELDRSIERAVELGASIVGEIVEEATNSFHVMRDPEGNEFCLVMLRRQRRLRSYSPTALGFAQEILSEGYLLHRAVVSRARSEQQLLDAAAQARVKGLSWQKIGELIGTSAQAAQQRCGAIVESV